MASRKQPTKVLRPTACSSQGVDLSSLCQTRLPSIVFKPPKQHDFPVVVLDALNPLGTCMVIKEWLFRQISPFLEIDDHFLRIEPLELSSLEPNTVGSLILLEHAAHIEDPANKGRRGGLPISILALLMPKDPRVRFFYIQGSVTPLLERLASLNFISETARIFKPTKSHLDGHDPTPPDHHCRLYIWLQEAFLASIAIPDHEDYVSAMALTDYAPFIKDSEADPAIRRLERCDMLYATKDEAKDLSDDRYVFALHEAERVVASHLGLGCGEYLLVKRNFFRAFKDDVLHNEKKLERENAKVRTEYAHAQWLESVYDWKLTRAKRLVVGWRELGLLEEKGIRAWIRSGGQFEFADHYEDEE